jgi:hypothetical protein
VGNAQIIKVLDDWAAIPRGEIISANDSDFIEWIFEYWPRWVEHNWVRTHGIIEFGLKYMLRPFAYVLAEDPAYCGRLLRLHHNDQEIPRGSKPFIVWLRRNMEDFLETPMALRGENPVFRQLEPDRWYRGGNPYGYDAFRAFRARFASYNDMIQAAQSYAPSTDPFAHDWRASCAR